MMAELLVKAQEPWNNDIDTSKMRKNELTQFNARSRKGDIIVIRPDGWKWGREECLPRFIVVKAPGLDIKDAVKFESAVYEESIDEDGNPKFKLLKRRKYAFDSFLLNSALRDSINSIEISKDIILNKIKEK